MPTPFFEHHPKDAHGSDPAPAPTSTPSVFSRKERKPAQFHNESLGKVPWTRMRKTAKVLLPILAILIGLAWAYQAGKLPWLQSNAENLQRLQTTTRA